MLDLGDIRPKSSQVIIRKKLRVYPSLIAFDELFETFYDIILRRDHEVYLSIWKTSHLVCMNLIRITMHIDISNNNTFNF